MSLTGPQLVTIQQALLDAYNRDTLKIVVKVGLNADFDAITPDKDLAAQVYDVVVWADKRNQVSALIACAVAQNPGNPALQALAADAQTWHIDAPTDGVSPYQGLAFFDVGDADRFFGRDKLTAELVTYLKDHRFLAKTGLRAYGNKYLNGLEAAAKLGITLDTPFEGLPLHRIDPKLAALTPDLDKPYPAA